jgi:hypothetical protein
MTPLLPSNPNTISRPVLAASERLEWLRRVDTYERKTNPDREAEKVKLYTLIEQKYDTHIS